HNQFERATCFTSTARPLYVKLELRAITKSHGGPRDRGGDLFANTVDDVVPLGIARYVLERHRDRRFVGQWQRRFRPRRLGQRDAVDTHRLGDILDLLLAQILKAEVEFITDLVAHDAADADPAGSAKASSRAATLTLLRARVRQIADR